MKSLLTYMKPLLTLSAGSLLLAACALAPTYEQPDSPMPGNWDVATGSVGMVEQPLATTESVSAAATLNWQDFVADDQLRSLIQLALENNRDLRQALLNVDAVRAQYRIQRADRLPGVGGQASASRQRQPGDMTMTGDSQIQENYQIGLGVTAFELDLFGRVRNLTESQWQTYLATEQNARSAQISLVAAVIQSYLAYDSAQQRYELTSQTLESRDVSLNLIARQRQAGTASALDHEEARTLVEQARAERERGEREVRQAANALTLLVGTSGADITLPERPTTGTLLVQDLAPGLPSELLIYRPDIVAAEHQLRARNADIGVARAAFFPRISLTGMLGFSSADLSDLFDSGQRTWSFMPQLTVPLFDAGRNRANLDLAEVRSDMAVAAYEGTIQTAFREVADALAATDTLRREEDSRRSLAESSTRALELSEARYRAGVDDHLRYLDAQRRDFANQMMLIDIAAQRQAALTDLFKALGGGWSAGTPVAGTP